MIRLLDLIEKILDSSVVEVDRKDITKLELHYLKTALRAKITSIPDQPNKLLISAFWKYVSY